MAKRLEKIKRFINNKNIDAVLIKSKTMKKYIDTLTGGGCQVLITKNKSYIVIDGRYIAEAEEKEKDLEIILNETHKTGKSYIDVVIELLKINNCNSLGIENSSISIKEYLQLQEKDVNIVLLSEELNILRIKKDYEEIKIIKEAISITDEIYNKVLNNIKVGMSEYEVSAMLQYYAIKYGAQQMSFDTIVATGKRSAMPHGRPTNKIIEHSEPILIDFGIQYKNYQSDMTRVAFIGKPKPEIEKIYYIVKEAQQAGVLAMKKGNLAKYADKAARDIIEKNGYGKYFTHGLGHGIGIGDGCEYPIINQNSDTELDDGMIMSCEPGIYIPELGGIRIEDDVLIENGIGVPLNKTTKELIIIDGE